MQKFYKLNEDEITPSSISFIQVIWDMSVNYALHTLGIFTRSIHSIPFYIYLSSEVCFICSDLLFFFWNYLNKVGLTLIEKKTE